MIKNLALVFVGGGLGSSLRYLLSHYLNRPDAIPYGTFLANVSGSLLIGLILGLALKNELFSPQTMLLLAVGFCGGYTTFSSFAYENYLFLKNDEIWLFALYTLGSITLGIAAVFAGIWISRLF